LDCQSSSKSLKGDWLKVIEVKNLCKSFGDHLVLNNIDYKIEKGEKKAVKKAEKNLLKNLRNSTIFHTFAYEKTYPTRDVFL
jgi:hypothetical protein